VEAPFAKHQSEFSRQKSLGTPWQDPALADAPAVEGVFVRITHCVKLLRIEPWSQPRNVNLYFGEANGTDFFPSLTFARCHALELQLLLV
jgi:hypothetical protein